MLHMKKVLLGKFFYTTVVKFFGLTAVFLSNQAE